MTSAFIGADQELIKIFTSVYSSPPSTAIWTDPSSEHLRYENHFTLEVDRSSNLNIQCDFCKPRISISMHTHKATKKNIATTLILGIIVIRFVIIVLVIVLVTAHYNI